MPPKPPVSSYHNKNLVDLFSKHLSHIEHFVFYGTLLGLVRQGQPIEGDDDVDVLVAFNREAYETHGSEVREGGVIIYNSDDKEFENFAPTDGSKSFGLPIDEEAFGSVYGIGCSTFKNNIVHHLTGK